MAPGMMAEQSVEQGKHLLLLVDDHRDILASVQRALKCPNYDIHPTTDPHEALRILESEPVDLIISDVDMPEMNGHELMSEAQRVRPCAVRILLTGGATLESALQAINEGEVHRYIRKPFDVKQLRHVVAQALKRKEELAIVSEAGHIVRRRELMLSQLEKEHPGITKIARDETGAYLFDKENAALSAEALGLAALVYLE